jgi:hypothetical protein
MNIYTLRCGRTGETQDVVVCAFHEAYMPSASSLVSVQRADNDCVCEFCAEPEFLPGDDGDYSPHGVSDREDFHSDG